MLDYKNIIIKRYTLNLSFKELAEEFGASRSMTSSEPLKSAINFLIRFRKGSLIMPSLSWFTVMFPEVTTAVLNTSSLILSGYSGR